MSEPVSSSAFWAQKSEMLKTSASATAQTDISSAKPNGKSVEKARMVLKSKTNGITTTRTPRKTDWADSDEDEDFIASFSALKNPRIVSLEQQLEQKDVSIEALNAVLDTKNVRIAELEDIVEHNGQLLINLEEDVGKKVSRIKQLVGENHKQFLYIQELVAEVDEKSRLIKHLEADLDEKCALICDLEVDSELQTQVSAGDTEKTDYKTDTTTDVSGPAPANKGPTDEALALDTPIYDSPPSSPMIEVTAEYAKQPEKNSAPLKTAGLECSVEPAPAKRQEQQHAEDAPQSRHRVKDMLSDKNGPTVNNSLFPNLWTPDMAKKAIPVENPKVLKMAIDTTKWGKKPSPGAQKTAPSSNKRSITPTHGFSLTRRAKTDIVPKFQVHKDIREMPLVDRILFANGPEVSVVMGSATLATLPKYVLMQCSGIAYKHFTEHPDATSITFASRSMDAEAAKLHLSWMFEMTYQGRVYSVTLIGDEKHDVKNLKICQAARVLGLTNMYVGHFTKILCDRVRSRPSFHFMSLVCKLAYPTNDPIFECLANNLVNQTLHKADSKWAKEIEDLCARHPVLKEQMTKIERRVKDSRAADKRKSLKSRDESFDSRRK